MGKKKSEVKRNLTVEHIANRLASEFINQEEDKFRFYGPNTSINLPIFIQGNNCKILTDHQTCTYLRGLAISLQEDMSSEFKKLEMLCLTARNASAILETLRIERALTVKEKIKTFAFKSDPSLTFNRLPFDPSDEILPCETWDRCMANFTNNKAVQMWIGSVFMENSNRAQYLWLYGRGSNGKSTVARVIGDALGEFVRFEQTPIKEDKYWTYGLIGKRLIVIDDCNNHSFTTTGLFKSCTGSGRVRVEQKFSPSSDAELDCKFLFTSNKAPGVSSEIADQRRLIFSSTLNSEEFAFDPTFEAKLGQELPNFLSNCIRLYKEKCGDGRPIPSDQTEALELGEIFNEEIEAWVDQNFEYDPNSRVAVSDFRAALSHTKLNDRRVYAFLEDKNVTRKVASIAGKSVKVLEGLKRKIYQIRVN